MKRILLMAVATATLMSSCSKNEPIDSSESTKQGINFSTYVGTTTKAADLADANFLEFKAYAYYLENAFSDGGDIGATYIEGTHVTRAKSTDTWANTGTYYWPSTGNLNFFAYSPTVAGDRNMSCPIYGSTPYFTYTPGTDVAKQSDVVVALAMNRTKDNGQGGATGTGAVKLTFKHALTKIQFAAQGAEANNITYTVTNVKVKGVFPIGIFSFARSDGATTIGNWVGQGTLEEYVYFTDEDPQIIEGKTRANIIGTNGSLMLIPHPSDIGGRMLEVTYTVKQGGIEIAQHTKEVDINKTAWTVGQSLRYLLTLPVDATPITFETEVLDAWDPEAGTDTPGGDLVTPKA